MEQQKVILVEDFEPIKLKPKRFFKNLEEDESEQLKRLTLFDNYTLAEKKKLVKNICRMHLEVQNYKQMRIKLISESEVLPFNLKHTLVKDLKRDTLVDGILKLMNKDEADLLSHIFLRQKMSKSLYNSYYSRSTYYSTLNKALSQFLAYYYA